MKATIIFLICFDIVVCHADSTLKGASHEIAVTNSSCLNIAAACGLSQPAQILSVMERVADWQLTCNSTNANHFDIDWIRAVGDAGMMALVGISGEVKYRDATLAIGHANKWQLGPRIYDADDYCIGQTWCELYFLYRDPKMIAPMIHQFDTILAHPAEGTNLEFNEVEDPATRENWAWADSLFMGPPVWIRLYSATGNKKYLDFAVTNWWRTVDLLYDRNAHLFFRDNTYFRKMEANGQKVFWSRGNGWVMAGLVRVLEYLPVNHPDRQRFENLLKEMADTVIACQQADGLWRASLLDPASFPIKESSGSALFTYALAWGVNQGLLDRKKYEPSVMRAWGALVQCVDNNGRLTHVQPVGADPKTFSTNSTEAYGVGAFLLAGSEIYRLQVLKIAKATAIKVFNPADFWRENETVELDINSLNNTNIHTVVMDGRSSRILASQVYATETNLGARNKLLFQIDASPGERRIYYLLDSTSVAALPPPIVKTFARFVPERLDDFAWESDRIAYRAYGLALVAAEGKSNSAPDVWVKKDRRLIVNEMYAKQNYHDDNGEFMDDYKVDDSRGCGGLGIWDGAKLYTSSNWKKFRLITCGPIRSEFELTYDAWDVGGGRKVAESKRYSIDAGSWFTHASCTFACTGIVSLKIAVGLAERACPTNRQQYLAWDKKEGWVSYWQPEDTPKGVIGVATILPKGSMIGLTNDAPDLNDSVLRGAVPQPTKEGYPPIRDILSISKLRVGAPFEYYFGACWNRSGDFIDAAQWNTYVKKFAERRDQPLQITITN